ncbi:nicotinamidase [Stachybotrys elegans]|uniref:nicotinamidase n=1 Tax=Stachybotrys elegans TaxID=80388 RepID=A0A8K0SLA0_9HYPO|nr:nicotinamidase [Stachybotrys elegans]
MAFKPALVVVDFQQDFCPPTGSLAVPDGLSILPVLNTLLSYPFPLKIATRDWHPPDHVSFAANHSRLPQNSATAVITHPTDPSQSYVTALWPVHCVQDTPGAEIVPGLHVRELHRVIDKGMDPRVEMYSAFYDPFHVSDSGLAKLLKDEGVTDVFVVGLAADFCVKATAEHAFDEGFRTYIVHEATKPVFPETWGECSDKITGKGIKLVSMDGPELARLRA